MYFFPFVYLVHEAHTILAIADWSVTLLPDDTSNTNFSYAVVLTCKTVWEEPVTMEIEVEEY